METFSWPPRPEGHTPDLTGTPGEPWLTRQAIAILEARVKWDDVVLEYGSGASTIWFAKRVSTVHTIEHDPAWGTMVMNAMAAEGVENAFLWAASMAEDFKDYVEQGRRIAEIDRPSIVLVDGRRRVRCVKAVVPFVPLGGCIILDNAERPNYKEVHDLLKDWDVERTDNGLWRTDIFTRRV